VFDKALVIVEGYPKRHPFSLLTELLHQLFVKSDGWGDSLAPTVGGRGAAGYSPTAADIPYYERSGKNFCCGKQSV
jgi:hypothetical protein